jgi:hypothetical protein
LCRSTWVWIENRRIWKKKKKRIDLFREPRDMYVCVHLHVVEDSMHAMHWVLDFLHLDSFNFLALCTGDALTQSSRETTDWLTDWLRESKMHDFQGSQRVRACVRVTVRGWSTLVWVCVFTFPCWGCNAYASD